MKLLCNERNLRIKERSFEEICLSCCSFFCYWAIFFTPKLCNSKLLDSQILNKVLNICKFLMWDNFKYLEQWYKSKWYWCVKIKLSRIKNCIKILCRFCWLRILVICDSMMLFKNNDEIMKWWNTPGINYCYWNKFCIKSRVAQWKRAGPITQRSVDRNYALLNFFSSIIFIRIIWCCLFTKKYH